MIKANHTIINLVLDEIMKEKNEIYNKDLFISIESSSFHFRIERAETELLLSRGNSSSTVEVIERISLG